VQLLLFRCERAAEQLIFLDYGSHGKADLLLLVLLLVWCAGGGWAAHLAQLWVA
jgi:hypothetical protein